MAGCTEFEIMDMRDVTAVILAGGKGRRMDGQDKGLVEFAGRPLVEYVIEAIESQVATVMLNANRNQQQYARYGYPVISDALEDYQGPLAGFLSALNNARTDYVVTLPCDGPFIASDLVARLIAALNAGNADIAVAHDGERMQPVYSLIPARLSSSLEEFLDTGERKIDRWYQQLNVALADFSDCADSFRNINTAEQRDRLQNEGATS